MVVIDALRDQQRSDTWYKDIINYLENGILPDASNKRRDILIISNCYVIDNGILFHLFTQDRRKIKNTDIRLQICVPKKFIKTVLQETHNSLLTGNHMGIHRTLAKTRLSILFSLVP